MSLCYTHLLVGEHSSCPVDQPSHAMYSGPKPAFGELIGLLNDPFGDSDGEGDLTRVDTRKYTIGG